MTHFITDLTDLKIAIGISIAFVFLFGSYALFDMYSKRKKYTLSQEQSSEIWRKICLSLDELEKIENETKQDN